MWKFLKIFCALYLLEVGSLVHSQGSTTWSLPLPSESYSEGECISPQVVNVDVNWIIQQKTFYIPIASQFAMHRYAETLLSRPPTSESEFNSMCLTVEASQSGAALNLTNVGYDDREFRQSCTPGAEPGRINCFAAGSSAGVNPTKTRATEDFVVAWDSRSYMIIVRCVDGFFRDFSVFSTRPTVSHDVYNSVLNVTRHLGFDERRIQTATYDSCLRTSAGLNSSKFNLNQRTGPFTNSVLAAPFANVRQPVVRVVAHQQHQHVPQHVPLMQGNVSPLDHTHSQGPSYEVHNNHQGQVQQQFPFGPGTFPGGPGGPGYSPFDHGGYGPGQFI